MVDESKLDLRFFASLRMTSQSFGGNSVDAEQNPVIGLQGIW
jgi:hypothetical protein